MPYKNSAHQRRYFRAYNRRRKEGQKKLARTWYEQNRDKALRNSARNRVRRDYDMSLGEYKAKRRKAKRCPICLKPFGRRVGLKPVLDHNHKTKVVREFIHGTCNRAIGYLQESPAILRRAAEYLERHHAQ